MKILTECIEKIFNNGEFTTILLKSGDVIRTSPKHDGYYASISFTELETSGELRSAISIDIEPIE